MKNSLGKTEEKTYGLYALGLRVKPLAKTLMSAGVKA